MAKYGNRIQAYSVGELLGRGAFAKVYRATCHQSGSEVAIKKIDKELMRAKDMESRVKQEVEIHSSLSHPYILQFLTWFEDRNYIYLVLELCHEGDLQRYLDRRKTLAEALTCEILSQVVEGLLYLHSNKIIHRDMSPANILLTTDKGALRVKISDFGLATRLQQGELNKTMLGTPNYISPEVASSRPHGLEFDIWGLGAILFTMLAGTAPFDRAGDINATFRGILESEVEFPCHFSFEARSLITSLLKKDPNERMKLREIRQHAFMLKHKPYYRPSSSASNRTDSTKRWLSSDSGVASNLSSSLSLPVSQFGVESNVSGRVPILNGAHRKHPHTPNENIYYSTSFHRSHQQPQSLPPSPVVSLPKIPTPAINSQRLQPVRQKAKNVIVNILDSGEVCLEFTRCRDGPEVVYEVLRISQDGLRIILYQPNRGKGVAPSSSPPPFPPEGAATVYSYDSIPEKLWKKYSYAAKFVDLVKTKTPKVTFYSKSAKCFLMENSPDPDFEACFYEGGKITKSGNLVKLIESNGQSFSFETRTSPHLSPSAQLMWEHFEKCLKHCQKIEQSMNTLSQDSGDTCFPVIVGRRPPEYMRVLQSSSLGNKENLSPTAPSVINVRTMGGYEASVISASSKARSSSSKPKKVIGECEFPAGRATQYANGDITLSCKDGTTILVNPAGTSGTYTSESGLTLQYNNGDTLPPKIQEKLLHMPEILKAFIASSQQRS